MPASVPHRRKRRRQMAEINVVPYIDVSLVLLVIFMITAPLLTQGVQVNLPQAAAEPIKGQQAEPVVVSVDAAGEFYYRSGTAPDEAVDAKTLLARVAAVRKVHPKAPVLVKGDDQVPYGKVVQAMVLLQRAGVADVGLMTRTPEDGGKG